MEIFVQLGLARLGQQKQNLLYKYMCDNLE